MPQRRPDGPSRTRRWFGVRAFQRRRRQAMCSRRWVRRRTKLPSPWLLAGSVRRCSGSNRWSGSGNRPRMKCVLTVGKRGWPGREGRTCPGGSERAGVAEASIFRKPFSTYVFLVLGLGLLLAVPGELVQRLGNSRRSPSLLTISEQLRPVVAVLGGACVQWRSCTPNTFCRKLRRNNHEAGGPGAELVPYTRG